MISGTDQSAPSLMTQGAYRKYLLALLMVILACNFLDRTALGIVLQDIKGDLRLSDTQLGFLSGIAFALFYSVMGIPIARWADRGSRVTVIGITTSLWSAGVALCGMATSFAQLLLIRVGVAVGEAGCQPAALSLIAEYFSRAERPRAVGIYMMGIPLSLILGFFVAGWLNQFYGWRFTFVILGLPGLLIAAIAWLTLREPRRSQPTPPADRPRVSEVWATLRVNSTFRRMLYCYVVSFFFNYGLIQWQPAFFIRSYGLQTGEIGTWFAIAYGFCGLLGNYAGGALASRYAASDERLQLRAMAVLYCSFGVFSALVYVAPNEYWAFASLGFGITFLSATNGPFLATVQTLVPAQMRAVAVAIMLLCANLIGMGLGPVAAGALSDALRPSFGDESLRYALLILCPGFLWCMWNMWRASGTVRRDLAMVKVAGSAGRKRDGRMDGAIA